MQPLGGDSHSSGGVAGVAAPGPTPGVSTLETPLASDHRVLPLELTPALWLIYMH